MKHLSKRAYSKPNQGMHKAGRYMVLIWKKKTYFIQATPKWLLLGNYTTVSQPSTPKQPHLQAPSQGAGKSMHLKNISMGDDPVFFSHPSCSTFSRGIQEKAGRTCMYTNKTRPRFLRAGQAQTWNRKCRTEEIEIVLELSAEHYSVLVKSHPEPFNVLQPEGSVTSALNSPLSKNMLSKTDQCTTKRSYCHAPEVYDQSDLRYVTGFPNFSSVSVDVKEENSKEMDYTKHLHIYIYEWFL